MWQADRVDIAYDPHPDGRPDPGEVVWTWVPYEDDPAQGKDRPVLIVARQGESLVAVPMTSKDHDRDLAQEAEEGRFWFDVGSGPWDPAGRPSEVRLNRFLTIDPTAVRREGAVLDEARFNAVAAALAPYVP
ncbi:growth inhibitor PemK [Aeromicrobium sp. Root236]|nr:growth inhibitor PemK [Aeromicrobium sp. Root236]